MRYVCSASEEILSLKRSYRELSSQHLSIYQGYLVGKQYVRGMSVFWLVVQSFHGYQNRLSRSAQVTINNPTVSLNVEYVKIPIRMQSIHTVASNTRGRVPSMELDIAPKIKKIDTIDKQNLDIDWF